MKDDAAAIALGPEKTGEAVLASDLQARDALRDRGPDRPRLDFQRNLAGLPILRDLRLVLQAQVEGRQSGGGVAQRTSLHQLRTQDQSVHEVRGK